MVPPPRRPAGSEVRGIVTVAVRQARPEQHHRVVQQRPAPSFTDFIRSSRPGELLDVPATIFRVGLDLLLLVLVMAELVMGAL
jgi:hypothetical protein